MEKTEEEKGQLQRQRHIDEAEAALSEHKTHISDGARIYSMENKVINTNTHTRTSTKIRQIHIEETKAKMLITVIRLIAGRE